MQIIASSSSGKRSAKPHIEPAERKRDRDRPQTNQQRRAIGLIDVRHRQPEPLEKVIFTGAQRRQAQQVLELIEHQQHRRPQREADDHGVRNVARQIAQPQQRNAGLDRADHQGQQNGGRNSFGIAETDQAR